MTQVNGWVLSVYRSYLSYSLSVAVLNLRFYVFMKVSRVSDPPPLPPPMPVPSLQISDAR